MKIKRVGDTYVVRLSRGEDIICSISELCKVEGIKLATMSAIGAVDYAAYGLYDVSKKKYNKNEKNEPLEIVNISGNITYKGSEPYLHLHASLADAKGNVFGGHLNSARVSATCEVIIKLIHGSIERKFDEEIGLNVFDI